eukprot:TRINITY_DN26756_c0_g3_i1.p1 TRINITY_DN26756_c0_g3~~TRINITY_DN26756_c0_g3_i1.p1  ORF type:complete len:2437 (+),score=322.57 TRINITY_DN26756_c0_g3_i1:864-7313(+)
MTELASGLPVQLVGTTNGTGTQPFQFVQSSPSNCSSESMIPYNSDISNCKPCEGTCGDGQREGLEMCDDGNLQAGDGCSPTCLVEPMFLCTEAPNYTINTSRFSTCLASKCGDGVVDRYEECDDSNVLSSDGCSALCFVESGYRCTVNSGQPSLCMPVCGDGRRAGREICDDGNARQGDGCDNACHIEPGFVCQDGTPTTPDYCWPKCGDGRRLLNERCDDGNSENGDGCSSTCIIEQGFACVIGNVTSPDRCYRTVCGDGIAEGVEECDDFNAYGGDGCSATCMLEPVAISKWSSAEVRVAVQPLPQVCRIYNERQHNTMEDVTYHLQNTVLTGDVSNESSVRIHVRVVNGTLAIQPLIDIWLTEGKNDSVTEALVERETGLRFYPYSENMGDTILSGHYSDVDRFLRHYLYIAPQTDFAGFVQVLFTVTSGIYLNHGAEECGSNVVIRVTAVYDDPASIFIPDEFQTRGLLCAEGAFSCSLQGITVYDPDCAMAVDGSCYLNVNLTVTVGKIILPGYPEGAQRSIPSLVGHHPGLNAALAKLTYEPPAARPADGQGELIMTVTRDLKRTLATPSDLFGYTSQRVIRLEILPADTAPTVSLTSGEPFHGAIFPVVGKKPFIIRNIVFEPPGSSTLPVIVELKVSRGVFFLGDRENLWFENGTDEGTSRLQFQSTSEALRNQYMSDIRYAWDDTDCANMEQFNITTDSGVHPPKTVTALMILPDCQGYSASWAGGVVRVSEDSEVSLTEFNFTTSDDTLFLTLDVRHPQQVQGDCKFIYWPEAVSSFVAGRECHLDGSLEELKNLRQYLVYRPPPNFFGNLRLEVDVARSTVEDEVTGVKSAALSSQRVFIDVQVDAVNDAPQLEVTLDSYTIQEDVQEPVLLSPMFVSDIDAGNHTLSFTFDLVLGHEWNLLHMCELMNVAIEDPWEHRLDETGCLREGVGRLQINSTVENFNSMQRGPGRLRFIPAKDWHGVAMINITVDDRGSGLGEHVRQVITRSLHIIVEPVADKPKLLLHCSNALPFVSYGHTCLEVKECLGLNATADAHDEAISFWLSIQASHPGVSISLENTGQVQVWREGTASIQLWGLYEKVQLALRALIFRPPPYAFANADDPDEFQFDVDITAYALGQMFNEPLPLQPGLLGTYPTPHHSDLGCAGAAANHCSRTPHHAGKSYPSDLLSFPVVFRRVNRAPELLVDVPYFTATQLQPDVHLRGVTISDPDARIDDELEVRLSVDQNSGGGALAFSGLRGKTVSKRMTLRELNEDLQDLRFIFQDAQWFGVAGVVVEVSDLGNRGWSVDSYGDMYHQDVHPQVLALDGGSVSLFPKHAKHYQRLFAEDFTWEIYCKRLPGKEQVPPAIGTTPPPQVRPFDLDDSEQGSLFRNLPLPAEANEHWDSSMNDTDNLRNTQPREPAMVSLRVGKDGFATVLIVAGTGERIGGTSNAHFEIGQWYHIGLVVRRGSRDADVAPPDADSDTTAGEVALYVDGRLDTAWPWHAPKQNVGPVRRSVLELEAAAGSGLVLSRARLWHRHLEAGDLGQCGEPLAPVAGGPEGIGDDRPPPDADSLKPPAGAEEEQPPALSFSFGGVLTETHHRALAKPTGSWSFMVDSPPQCSHLTESPYDNFLEQCVAYDRSLAGIARAEGGGVSGLPYFWHSPEAFAGLMHDLTPWASTPIKSVENQSLKASTLLAVHRSFVNEPPTIILLEPRSGILKAFEDHHSYVSLQVTHKADELLVPRALMVTLTLTHGRLRTISGEAVVRTSMVERRIEYRGRLRDINNFLAQLEYVPDKNYHGEDHLKIIVTDDEYTANATIPIEVASLSDPLLLVCPPAIDLFEGETEWPIGANITIRDGEPAPGVSDQSSKVSVSIMVGEGGLHLLPRRLPILPAQVQMELAAIMNSTPMLKNAILEENASFVGTAAYSFNSSLATLRTVLRILAFTPHPKLYHGIVHFEMTVSAAGTDEEERCEIALVVHPVNTAPVIHIDQGRLMAVTNKGVVTPHTDTHLAAVIQLSDPDEEDYSGGWFVQQQHSARLKLRVSCGTISFHTVGERDFVHGVQNGPIAGISGVTFHSGDGSYDTDMDITSTLENLNAQLQRLHYHSGSHCRGLSITIWVELDDLGNYGAGVDEFRNFGHPKAIVVQSEVHFNVSVY